MQGQMGSPLQGTSGMSPDIQFCSLLGLEASVSSWLDWGWGRLAGCIDVLKTEFLHRSGASWVVVDMLQLVTMGR